MDARVKLCLCLTEHFHVFLGCTWSPKNNRGFNLKGRVMNTIKPRGKNAAIIVKLTSENLKLLRGIPSSSRFSGNVFIFDPTPVAVDYVKKNFPNLDGLDQFNQDQVIERAPVALATEWELDWSPYEHQKAAFKASWAKKSFMLRMGVQTGKSATALLNGAWLAWKRHIDAVLIIAPNGVHRKWIKEEIPKFWPKCVPHYAAAWGASMSRTEGMRFEDAYKTDKVSILSFNIEAFSHVKRAEKIIQSWAAERRVFLILDESHLIKSPGSKRTQALMNLRKRAAFVRTLTGTAGQPIDYYAQYNFLDKSILGFSTFEAFKRHFAVMVGLPDRAQQPYTDADGEPIRTDDRGYILGSDGIPTSNRLTDDKGKVVVTDRFGNPLKKDRRGRPIRIIATDRETGEKKYKNLEQLRNMVEPYTFTIQTEECNDLPPKLYSTVPVELTKEQRRLYETLRDETMVEFEGRTISAALIIQQMTRFRQIVGGFLPDEENNGVPINKVNPRLERMIDKISELDGAVIIWASFQAEIKMIAERLRAEYGHDQVVTYYGGDNKKQRETDRERFQDGDVRFFVSNPVCGGIGFSLYVASKMIFYSNPYGLKPRQQAEGRILSSAQSAKHCIFIDMLAEGTIDERIRNALLNDYAIESRLTGRQVLDWLSETI